MHTDRSADRLLERLPLAAGRPFLSYGIPIAISGVAFLIRYTVEGLLPAGFPFLTFFPAVIISAFLFGRGPGLLSAVLCGVLAATFLPTEHGVLTRGNVLAMTFYSFIVLTDIALVHWMQRAFAQAAKARARSDAIAANRELLFRELQHRVSNSLQVVAALLTLQKRSIEDASARAALDEASRRLGLVGRIHRQLHDPTGELRRMEPFLRELCADVIDAAGRAEVALRIDADPGIALQPEAAVPLALIVAETIANALEHGLPDGRQGTIDVRLTRLDGQTICLEVEDDGQGLPPGFAAHETDSLGLRIAMTLARQLGGTFSLARHANTVARLVMPA
jgi:two-component sensor histidine kinase